MRGVWLSVVTWALVALGTGLCLLLVLRTMALASGVETTSFDLCSVALSSSCDATLGRQDAAILGIPWAGWGLVYYVTLLVLLGLSAVPGRPFCPEMEVVAFLLALAAAATSVALTSTMLVGPVPLCAICLLVHGTGLTLVPLLWRRTGLPARGFVRHLRAALSAAQAQDSRRPVVVVALLCAGLVGTLVYQRVDLEWRLRGGARPPPYDFQPVLASWLAAPAVEVPLRDDDPRVAAAGAPAELVVFSSLQCAGCAQLARFLSGFARRVGPRLTIVFKHFPLGRDCNPEVDADHHPHACAAASAAEAARMQGRFWDFHDAVFAISLVDGVEILGATANALKFDMDRFEADRASAAVAARVATDIELGRRLGVEGTPTMFLNGRRIDDRRAESVARLILHACEHGRPRVGIPPPSGR